MNSVIKTLNGASRMEGSALRRAAWLGLVCVAVMATGCSTRSVRVGAPVEDRLKSGSSTGAAATKIMPGAENAGKAGYFTVRPGDTLYRIAIEHGQSARDLQAWNGLANPNMIEVGQVLRVAPPQGITPSGAVAPVSTATAVAVVPAGAVARPLNAPATALPGAVPVAPAGPAPATAPESVKPGDAVEFIWPAKGGVIAQFDDVKNKGISIGGRVGEPVLAAADGRVVYAGAGLRGYGNLIILKHNDTFLTAYAHNQALLVREDQAVKRGQRIAEMGSSDADRVKLHFEVRRDGKPVDPLQYLPKQN